MSDSNQGDHPILNPRYAGATPEDVAKALLRPLRAPSPGRQAVVGDEVTVEQSLPDKSGDDGSHLREGV